MKKSGSNKGNMDIQSKDLTNKYFIKSRMTFINL